MYWTETLNYDSNYDLRVTLLDKYLGSAENVWSEIMFCDSDLLEKRNPDIPAYKYDNTFEGTYSTLSYYNIPKSFGTLLITDFDNSTLFVAEPENALWSCTTLDLRNGRWLGHDSPLNYNTPAGSSTSFIDGSAKWIPFNSQEDIWIGTYGFLFKIGKK